MAERIAPPPSLRASAAPVDRFVAPVRKQANPQNQWSELAAALADVNPALQSFIATQHQSYVAQEEAKGATAEVGMSPDVALERNREGWASMISEQRKRDRAEGTNVADQMMGASPHFRRGVFRQRAERLGMMLNDHLASLYQRNPQLSDGRMLQDVDDAQAVHAWAQDEINSFTQANGLGNMDPILVSETYNPLAQRAAASIGNLHSNLRLERYKQEYSDELYASASIAMSGGTSVDAETGMSAAAMSARTRLEESFGSLNITSAYRSPEHNKAVGGAKKSQHMHGNALDISTAGMSREQANDLIVKARQAGFSGIGIYKDSIHVDVGGDRNWGHDYHSTSTPDWAQEALATPVGSHMEVSPVDSAAAHFQRLADQADRDGHDHKATNQMLIDAVIDSAVEANDPEMLEVLNKVTVGSGPLGATRAARQSMIAAKQRIDNQMLQNERVQYEREERERKQVERQLEGGVWETLLLDPNADLMQFKLDAARLGMTSLVETAYSVQKKLQDEEESGRTDSSTLLSLTTALNNAATPQAQVKLQTMIGQAYANDLLSKADFSGLNDDLRIRKSRSPIFDDRRVNNVLKQTVEEIATNRYGEENWDAEGNPKGVVASRIEAEFWDLMYMSMGAVEGDLSLQEAYKMALEAQAAVLKMPQFTPREEPDSGIRLGNHSPEPPRSGVEMETFKLETSIREYGIKPTTMTDQQKQSLAQRILSGDTSMITKLADVARITEQEFLQRSGLEELLAQDDNTGEPEKERKKR